MQAVRAESKRQLDARWLQHLSLLSAVGFLLSWAVATRPQAAGQLVDSLNVRFLAPPSTPAQEWLPVRVPVRTAIPRDPSPPNTVGLAAAESGGFQWVQAHRGTFLLADPEPGAAREIEIPQWSYLRVVESRPGWLRVIYSGDGGDRPPSVAWVAATDIGASGAPPRFVTSTRQTQLWNSEGPSAASLGTVPRLATLELLGAERSGRVAVRLLDSDHRIDRLAWVDWEAVTGSLGPAERDLPLARPFSPFATEVRLDVPYRTQLDGSLSSASNCGPTALGMAMEAFGIAVATPQLRALANRFMGIYDPWGGTTLESLRDIADYYGLTGVDLYENGRYKRWTLEDLRLHLRAGQPVIPELRYRMMPGREWVWVSYDHYVVITGMVGDDFIYNDPMNIDGRGERVISGQALLRAWMNSDYPGAALALARPV